MGKSLNIMMASSECVPFAKSGGLADVVGAQLSEQDEQMRAVQKAPDDAPLVLVVDDNPDLRTFIAGNLASDYRIEMAENGLDGLEAARRKRPDLVVSDIMMPKMDGYEFCRQIRKDPLLSKVPVILATSKSGGQAVAEGLEVGANDYLAKPFEIRELKARVAAQLRTRNLERSLSERDSRLSAIGQMTSSIVHDLRNPLNAILGFAQIAKQDAMMSENKDVAQNLEPVISESQRLGRMITEVLEFARGQIKDIKLEPTALNGYLELICSPLKAKMERLGITLHLEHGVDEKMEYALDTSGMQRVIENLIRNAQEAMCSAGKDATGKSIWISTKTDERSLVIQVADDGPGIDDQIATSLFEPFSTSGKLSGTGLGLATVRNLVRAQNGDISVEAKGEKGGAVFSMRFPLKK